MSFDFNIIASQEDEGKRVDSFLAERTDQSISRTIIQNLVKRGAITLNGAKLIDKKTKIKIGDCLRFDLPEPQKSPLKPQKIPIEIIYEDEDVIIINKPPRLVVHPDKAHKDGTLVNALLYHCQGRLSSIGAVERPGIVHRLDMNTSGLLVAAKNQKAHIHLAQQFASGKGQKGGGLTRYYIALVWGKPPPGPQLIDAPIGRHKIHRQKMAIRHYGGKEAKTEMNLIKRVGQKASLLRLKLLTGRTHQIRVHLHALGFAIIGDPLYQERKNEPLEHIAMVRQLDRQALHAYHLGFIHPSTQKPIHFETPLPLDIQKVIEALSAD